MLSEEDKELARSLYLCQRPKGDKVRWNYTKSGIYSVSSGYWLSRHNSDSETNDKLIPFGDPDLKSQIWKLLIMPKLKTIYMESGTATRLNSRGISIGDTCQRCCAARKTINHLLFICPLSMSIWRLTKLHFTIIHV